MLAGALSLPPPSHAVSVCRSAPLASASTAAVACCAAFAKYRKRRGFCDTEATEETPMRNLRSHMHMVT